MTDYNQPPTKALGDSAPATDWNTYVRDNNEHHANDADHGSATMGALALGESGGLVSIRLTDASVLDAPGAGKLLLFSVSGRTHQRAGAAGDDEELETTDHVHSIASGAGFSDYSESLISDSTSYTLQPSLTQSFSPQGPAHETTVFLWGRVRNTNGVSGGTKFVRFLFGGVELIEITMSNWPNLNDEEEGFGNAVKIEPAAGSTSMTVETKFSSNNGAMQHAGYMGREVQCQ